MRISVLLAAEAMRDLPTRDVSAPPPIGELTHFQLNRRFYTLGSGAGRYGLVARLCHYRFADPSEHFLPMAKKDIDPLKLSSPRIFLVRMLVFVDSLRARRLRAPQADLDAFMANPGLNALIIGVLLIGIVLSFRQVIRLFPEIAWVNGFRLADPGLAVERPPVLLAPMAAILGDRIGRMAISSQTDARHPRFDRHPARRGARHVALHDRPAGLPRPARHVLGPDRDRRLGRRRHPAGSRSAATPARCSMRCARASPRRSAAWAFRSRPRCSASPARWCSASSTCRSSQAQNRFYTDLEDWLSTTVHDLGDRAPAAGAAGVPARDARARSSGCARRSTETGSSKAATTAMANLAEAIQGLVHHMRTEQQMIRDWVDAQAEQQREIRRLLEDHGARTKQSAARYGESNTWLLPARRRDSGMNYWPGFVDALSTLILGIIFLLTVFVVVQFYLQQEVAGKDTALTRLNAQIAQLTELLSLEKTGKSDLEDQLAQLRASLAARRERARPLQGPRRRRRRRRRAGARQGQRAHRRSSKARRRSRPRALAQVEVLNQQIAALRRQLAAHRAGARRLREEGQGIAEPHRRSRPAAQRRAGAAGAGADRATAPTSSARLREILGNRPDIRIVGDRFVLQSEVFFDTGKADLKPEGRAELDKIATRADRTRAARSRPTSPGCCASTATPTCGRSPAAQFKSNWDLSAARAIAVVQYLDQQGRAAAAAGRRRLRRIPADRHRHHRRGLSPQPPHRVQADGAVSALDGSLCRRGDLGIGTGRKWCHLLADEIDELHRFAQNARPAPLVLSRAAEDGRSRITT